ncbi:MAG: hypothetical protein ACI9D5_002528, partial [Candidatus Endobugula sp.]
MKVFSDFYCRNMTLSRLTDKSLFIVKNMKIQ